MILAYYAVVINFSLTSYLMRVGKESNVIILEGLKLTLRLADERDMGFCYELMNHNM